MLGRLEADGKEEGGQRKLGTTAEPCSAKAEKIRVGFGGGASAELVKFLPSVKYFHTKNISVPGNTLHNLLSFSLHSNFM